MNSNYRGRISNYNFPDWNYGYTLGPPSSETNGNYNIYPKENLRIESPIIPNESLPPPPPPPLPNFEKPLSAILGNRNSIIYCNEQSKLRSLPLEWEQVSEIGPPHDKTFTWKLSMGDLTELGSGNSKKSAKNAAAESMARQLDQLPQPYKRRMFYPPWMPNPPVPQWYSPLPPPSFKRRKTTEKQKTEVKALNPSQDNPISKLYEFCKQNKHSEPVFTTVSENVLESRRTSKGFSIKKTEFTIECNVLEKKYLGKGLTKKLAKQSSAEIAWSDLCKANS